VLPGYRGISVHDRYAQYWLFPCEHSACHAHLIRDPAAVAERASQRPWAEAMARLLLSAKDRADKAREAGRASPSKRQLRRIAAAYDDLVAQAVQPRPLAAGPGGTNQGRAGVLQPGAGLQGNEGRHPAVLSEPGGLVHLQPGRAGVSHGESTRRSRGASRVSRAPRHSAPPGATSPRPASTGRTPWGCWSRHSRASPGRSPTRPPREAPPNQPPSTRRGIQPPPTRPPPAFRVAAAMDSRQARRSGASTLREPPTARSSPPARWFPSGERWSELAGGPFPGAGYDLPMPLSGVGFRRRLVRCEGRRGSPPATRRPP
jgi:hypothetical protein